MLQGSVLGPLPVLIYINDLPNNLISNVNHFGDDTSIYSVVNNNDVSNEEIIIDVRWISEWAYQWKMMFNPDVTKQVQILSFSSPFIPMSSLMKFQKDAVSLRNI